MANLRDVLCNHGFTEVETYIQSGNISLEHPTLRASDLESEFKKLLLEHFQIAVPVIVLTKADLNCIIENNPFLKVAEVDEKALYVTFMDEISGIELKDEQSFYPDEFLISKKSIFLKIGTSYGTTKLNNQFFEKKLRVTATTRNWKTVQKLLAMAQ